MGEFWKSRTLLGVQFVQSVEVARDYPGPESRAISQFRPFVASISFLSFLDV